MEIKNVEPLGMKRRLKLAAGGDGTLNVVGEANMPAPFVPAHDGVSALVDSLIRDGWIEPENRSNEIITILQGNVAAAHRNTVAMREQRDALLDMILSMRNEAGSWTERYTEYMEA